MNIQAPPYLSPGVYPRLIAAGINDWGGISPVTPDHVNPEAPWPAITELAERTASAGKLLVHRLPIYPSYFAKVEPVPTSDDQKKIVALTLFVDPGSRVYVRHINFTGTTRSNDETLRRELRQLEGSWLSNVALERSKQRLQRDPFVESVEMSTEPVAGVPDEVDVNFAVKERPSATVGGGIGYSASQKFVLNGNFSDSDFFGGGDYVALNIDSGEFNKIYSFSQTDPYRNVDNLSRTVSMSFRDSTQFTSETSAFGSKNVALGLTYGYPISEYQGVSAGVSLQHVDLLTFESSSAQQAVRWVQQNGHPYTSQAVSTFIQPDGETVSYSTTLLGSRYNSVELRPAGSTTRATAACLPIVACAARCHDRGAPRRRGALLDRQLRVHRLPADLAQMGADREPADSHGQAAGRHDRHAALQALLCRWPRYGARLHRGHPGAGGYQRQPLRRQSADGVAHRS